MLSCCSISANEHDSLLRHDSFVATRKELIGDTSNMLSSILSGENEDTGPDDDNNNTKKSNVKVTPNGPHGPIIDLVTKTTTTPSDRRAVPGKFADTDSLVPIIDLSPSSAILSPGSNHGMFFAEIQKAASETSTDSDFNTDGEGEEDDDDDDDEDEDDDDDSSMSSIDLEELVLSLESVGSSGMPIHRSGSISSISTNSATTYDGSSSDSSICSSFSGNSSNSSGKKRAEFLSATVYKETNSATFGIGLRMSKSANAEKRVLKVASIDSKGLLANSPIREGDILYSINDIECRYMDAKTAGEFLRSLPKKQSITFICQNPSKNADKLLVESMITKLRPDHSTGLGLSRSDDDSDSDENTRSNGRGSGLGGNNAGPGVVICSIGADSLFAPSLLNTGDRILTVNNKSCKHLDTHATANLIRNATKTVSVLTKTQTEASSAVAKSSIVNTRPKFLCATFKKPDSKVFLGIALSLNVDRKNRKCLVISTLHKKGLLGNSALKVGDTLISINNKKFTSGDLDPKVAMSILKNLTGFVTIVAKSSDTKKNNKRKKSEDNVFKPSEMVEISFCKPTPDYRVGIALKRDENGQIRVCKVEDGRQEEEPSLLSLSSSFLRVNDILLSVNRVPCEELDLNIVASLIRNASTQVTIVALKEYRRKYSKMR